MSCLNTKIRIAYALTFALATSATPSHAQTGDTGVTSRFVGTWKEDVSKRDVAGMPHLRFQQNAAGELEQVLGPDAKPILVRVSFDGKPFIGPDGVTINWKQLDQRNIERVLSRDGRALGTQRLRIATDGKTMTDINERRRPDNRTVTQTTTYERISGNRNGLLGRWKVKSFNTSSPPVIRFEAAGPNGLKYSGDDGLTFTVMLDEKSVPATGPTTLPDTTVAARRVDDHTIEFRQARGGGAGSSFVRSISGGGKTMTTTIRTPRPDGIYESGKTVHVKQ